MLKTVLLILAVMCFGLAAREIKTPLLDLTALGLLFLALALLTEGHI
jgi:hypothetical protein